MTQILQACVIVGWIYMTILNMWNKIVTTFLKQMQNKQLMVKRAEKVRSKCFSTDFLKVKGRISSACPKRNP
jgi:hypothetical protein